MRVDVRIRSTVGAACAAVWLAAAACGRSEPQPPAERSERRSERAPDRFAAAREAMVREHVEPGGVSDPAVLAAMRAVPRHELVPAELRDRAYEDTPLPIGLGQTISQPSLVALMTQLAEVRRGERVLEVGTGSGYQAAVLAAMGAEVYSIEILEPMARRAAADLARLGYRVHVRAGDGYRGWPEVAPFDAIVVTAAPPHVPRPLVEQLAAGGRMVIPVGDKFQELRVLTKDSSGGVREESVTPVLFVPMTGEAEGRR